MEMFRQLKNLKIVRNKIMNFDTQKSFAIIGGITMGSYLIACIAFGTPAMFHAFASAWSGLPLEVIAFCNEGNNMREVAACGNTNVSLK